MNRKITLILQIIVFISIVIMFIGMQTTADDNRKNFNQTFQELCPGKVLNIVDGWGTVQWQNSNVNPYLLGS